MSEITEREVAIFSAARRLAAGERAAFLDQACGGDAALRRRLGELLSVAAAAGEFLEKPAQPDASPAAIPGGSGAPSPPLSEKPGQRIGPYKLLQEIGQGGCGVVYMAEQQEPMRRRVALKVIKLGMDTRQVVGRFEAERQALALMDHPNIARVLDAGATDTGRPYFVMELVRGVKITEYCDQNNLPTEERLNLCVEICHALQHAHQKGIIHRDIKPSNILVTLHDGRPVPKVIDFGIAKATGGQVLTDKTLFTAFEQFIGTPAYMSPEQAEMSALDVDTRSDIYSLGVLLYELLTGKTPFDAKRLVDAGLEEIRRIIRNEEPPRPSTRLSTLNAEESTTTARRRDTDPPRLIHRVRGDLDWIVMKCLEKDRTRRYETASGLAMELMRHLRNEPVLARPPSHWYRFQRLVRRHKLTFAAAGFMFAALAIGLGVSLWSLRKANREAGRSRQVAQFLQDMLQAVGPSVALGRDTTLLREILDKTARRLDEGVRNQPEVEADLRTTIGRVYHDLGQDTRAEAMFRQALALQTKRLGPEHVEVARSLNDLGSAIRAQGRLKEAEDLFRQALTMKQKLLGREHPEVGNSLFNLAHTLDEQGKFAEAEALFREELAMREKLLGSEHPEVAASLAGVAGVLREQGKFAEAETLHRRALALQRKLLGSEHPMVALSLYNLANVLAAQGRLAEAETLHREALAMQKKLLGGEHPDVARSLNNLGYVLLEQDRFTEAEKVFREALAMKRKLLGSEHPQVASSLNNLADALLQEGKLAEAEAFAREGLAIRRKRLGNAHPEVARSLNNLAAVLRLQGKLGEAEALQREALALRKQQLGSDHPEVARSLDHLADVLRDQGKLGDAEALQRQALAILRKRLGNDHPDLAETLADLARTLLLEDKFIEAETPARDCLALLEGRPPQGWQTFEARSLLGAALVGQKKYPEAEPLLLSGCQGMKQCEDRIPAGAKPRLKEALQHLVQLYDALGKPEKAAPWRRELATRGL